MQARLRSTLLHATVPEQCRHNTVEIRSLMQADKWIGLEPMPTNTVKPVDHSRAHIGMVEQRIRKRHAGGASPHHLIVMSRTVRCRSTKHRDGTYSPRHANSRTNLRSTLM